MRSNSVIAWAFALTLGATGAACSAQGTPTVFGEGGGGTEDSGGQGGAGPSSVVASSSSGDISIGAGGGFGVGGGGVGDDTAQISEVYGHGPGVLYRMDPKTKEVTTVGPFKGCNSVIDLAIDKDSNLYATTFGYLYKIDKATAACSQIASGSYPNSLSFVPAGTVDETKEALVGYNGATYVRIDTVSGAVSTIGSLSGGYSSSGDIVSVIGGKTYLTVTGPNCNDCIIEVNPVTGDLVKNWGPLGYGSVFGLAFWAGSAYGFTNGGQLFEVQFENEKAVTKAISIPGMPSGLSFWGAGSTTSAPPDPIPE